MHTYLKISSPKTNKTMSIIRHIFVNAVRYIPESGCENTNHEPSHRAVHANVVRTTNAH